jgi:putative transcriptional regulator
MTGTMNEIRHHPNDSLLMSYAAGTLPEAFSVVVAGHISLCEECRARLGAYEAIGGATLEDLSEGSMRADSLSKTLSLIHGPEADRIVVERRESDLPAPIGDYVAGDMGDIPWRAVGGGVRQLKLDTAGVGTVRLIYIPGGQAVPDHSHNGLELTMVLSGAYNDETDRFGPGDVEVAGDDFEHRPIAEDGAPCICIAATDAPLKFRGLIPRLLGQVVGI